jgi:hypothetical protein
VMGTWEEWLKDEEFEKLLDSAFGKDDDDD